MTSSAYTERRPHGSGWARVPVPESVKATAAISSAWTFGKLTVISSLVHAELPDGAGVGPQWFISVTRSGGRPTASDVRKAQRSFRMVGTEEDNHHPGHARHFWLPCDPAHRVACQCKADEATIKEPDGYTWTTPKDGTDCRGCEFERMTGKPCSLHGARAVPL